MMVKRELTHERNANKISYRILADHSSGRHRLECHNITDPDYVYAASVQAVVYNVLDSSAGKNQRYKSEIGPHPDSSMDETTETTTNNVPENHFSAHRKIDKTSQVEHRFES